MDQPDDKALVDILRDQIQTGQVVFSLSPERWADCKVPIALRWKRVRFTSSNRLRVPARGTGVYCFVLRPSFFGPPETAYLLYVGKADRRRFGRRYKDYLDEKTAPQRARPHINLMLNKWEDDLWFYYAPIEDQGLVGTIENLLLSSCIPPFNINFTAMTILLRTFQ